MAQGYLKLNTGYLMPAVALGCWQVQSWPGSVEKAVKDAVRAGYRHIDTAQVYLNEDEVGNAVQELMEAGEIKREDIFITTKLGMAMMHPTRVREEFQRSLENLKLDYVDLLLMHTPLALSDERLKDEPRTKQSVFPKYANGQLKLAFIDPSETYKEMEKLVNYGLVRSIGVSNFTIPLLNKIMIECEIVPANMQNECHVLYQSEELLQFCKEKGITFSAYSPLGNPGRPSVVSADAPNLLELPDVVKVADRLKRSPGQILLRFLIQRGQGVAPKSSNPARIKENIQDCELLAGYILSNSERRAERDQEVSHQANSTYPINIQNTS